MTPLEQWLKQATRRLSSDSAAQVRAEIREHYESEREAAISRGASVEEAAQLAVKALGSASAANCQYRKVLLTSAEAKLLRESNAEARAICSRAWLKWTLLSVPLALLAVAYVQYLKGAHDIARGLLLLGTAMGVVFVAPFLRINTAWRGRVYRVVKWTVLIGAVCAAFGSNTLSYFWLLASCIWIPVWIESTRISIRRKLPIARWPRQLYL